MDMPDLTRAQLLAIVQSIIAAAVAFGAPISEAQSVALLALAGALAAVLVHGDATIRKSRNDRLSMDALPGFEPENADGDVPDAAEAEAKDARNEA